MNDVITFGRGSVSHQTKQVGPRHDPYHRDIYTIIINGVIYTLQFCALEGATFKRGDEVLFQVWSGDSLEDVLDLVQVHTGYSSEFWTSRVWHLYNKARFRDPNEAAKIQLLEEMDRALLSYM